MKIVATDGHTLNPGDNPWDPVAGLGELKVYPRCDPKEVVNLAAEAEILIINKTKIPAGTLEKLGRLRFITMAATGFDCVDVAAAGALGVPVSNIPVYGTDSVSQYALALLLELCHRVGLHDQAVKAGEWTGNPDWSFWKTPLIELRGKVMGIVGFGRIGRRTGELAHALGMEVLAHDPHPGREPGYQPFGWASLEEVFAKADAVSLHSPQTEENAGFVKADLLGRMKPTAFLINTARGGLVNEADLARALDQGRLAGAAVDVVSSEPISPDNPLLKAKNILITPHLAWATREARERLMATIAENIRAFQAGRPINLVNQAYLKPRS